MVVRFGLKVRRKVKVLRLRLRCLWRSNQVFTLQLSTSGGQSDSEARSRRAGAYTLLQTEIPLAGFDYNPSGSRSATFALFTFFFFPPFSLNFYNFVDSLKITPD